MLKALLIGINDYHPDARVRPLAGCLNDVAAVRQLLLDFYADLLPNPDRDLRTLTNEQATRAGVVAAFRSHFAGLAAGDTIFIYYSGHGSWATTAAEFAGATPDAREEGWVLYDSRLPGNFDLADKEIALLLDEISRDGAEIVVIADSCHSGSVTRSVEDFQGWQARFTPGRNEPRPLESYLDGAYFSKKTASEKLAVPAPRHLLFAACDKTEVAWESDERCGVFTKNLLAALRPVAGRMRYADAFARACAGIRVVTRRQNPQAEAFGGFNPRGGFLGRSLPADGPPRRHAVVFQPEKRAWKIALGAAQGLAPDVEQQVEVELFDDPAAGQSLGKARLSYVGATDSTLDPGRLALNPTKTCWAEPLAFPQAPFEVYCPDAQVLERLQIVLKNRPESPLRFSADPTNCLLTLRAEDGNFSIFKTAENTFVHGVVGTDEAALQHLVEALEQAAAWQRLTQLRNRRTRIPEPAVWMDFEIFNGEKWQKMEGPELTLAFNEQPIPFAMTLGNRSGQDLHIALVHLDAQFGSQILWHDTAKVRHGQSVEVRLPSGNDFYLPPGVDEERDVLLLVASTDPIEQPVFSKPSLPRSVVMPGETEAFRAIGAGPVADWTTRALAVRIVRTASEGRVGERSLTLAGGQITLAAHPVFRSEFNLEALPATATRSASAAPSVADFFEKNPHVELVSLAATRDAGAVPFLDLSGIRGAESLAEQPLEINLTPGADEGSTAPLPFFFDGENFLPAGEISARADGSLAVEIRHIPDENPSLRTRSVGKAMRLFFLKFAKKAGFQAETQLLRWVDFEKTNAPERRSDELFEKIKTAEKCLLLLHGIIGDTKTMLEPLRFAHAERGYLVLTFDYENLNTPLETTALELKNRLLAAGFAPGDGKQLTLLAHSMGGLVARHFLEKLDGAALADRLICCGTPHAGSRFGDAPAWLNWASSMLGLGMHYFQWSLPALAGLVSALQFSREQLLVTLAQLRAGSDFLQQLAAGGQPPVPYHAIAGDVDLFFSKKTADDTPDFFEKILRQTGRWAYAGLPNDAAVSLESALLPAAATRTTVAGHHMNYFENESEGWAALRELI